MMDLFKGVFFNFILLTVAKLLTWAIYFLSKFVKKNWSNQEIFGSI